MASTGRQYTCSVNGCEISFPNEDHLNWHQIRHELVLNTVTANKNAEASDQTPTPTRFIRNCEEVGLFQDLQKINPFEETFKKAVEAVKSGCLQVPETNSHNDDTLHTPHIFPHEEGGHKFITNENDNNSTQSLDFCIANITENSDSIQTIDLTIDDDNQNNNEKQNNKTESKTNVKTKHKKKNPTRSQKSEIVNEPPYVSVVSIEKLKEKDTPQKRRAKDETYKKNDKNDRNKIRAQNRVAQLRSRRKKKGLWEKMEEELMTLKTENRKILRENQIFKEQFHELKKLLLETTSDNSNQEILLKIGEILNKAEPRKPELNPKQCLSNKIQLYPTTINPVSVIGIPVPPQGPVVIHVIGATQQVGLPVVPFERTKI